MKVNKLPALLLIFTIALAAFTSCSSKKNNTSSENSVSETNAATKPTAETLTMPNLEETHSALSSDAYLAISDGAGWIQYQGSAEDDGYMLAYDAGIAHIDGNGEYTVSVNADTDGFRYYVTGKIDGEYTPSGCSRASVIIKSGAELYPDADIEITSIKIDGNEIPITANNYTYTDNNGNICSDIFSAEDNAADSEQSASGASRIVDSDAFANGWLKVEVTFNVTGIEN